jgi:hypothetical protein
VCCCYHLLPSRLYLRLCGDLRQGRQKLQRDIHQRELLSPEGLRSEPYALKCRMYSRSTHLSLETHFSSDSVRNSELTSSAKTKRLTINHHKVKSPRFVCIFSEQDMLVALRAEQEQQEHHAQHGITNQSASPSTISLGPAEHPSHSNSNTSFLFAQSGSNKIARRPLMQVHGLWGMGCMGSGSVRPREEWSRIRPYPSIICI